MPDAYDPKTFAKIKSVEPTEPDLSLDRNNIALHVFKEALPTMVRLTLCGEEAVKVPKLTELPALCFAVADAFLAESAKKK